ncbi:MAG TPA: TRAP transporter small permease subunit [Burkholderiales bacterium]|nr:TRAP transporter small permease subunit [Burkholderiales bacterium]
MAERAARRVRAGIERFTDLTGRATSWLALVIVVLMAVNVLLRYLFSEGSVWAQELEWHLLAPLILFGMSYALLHGEHVRVDVFYAGFSERRKLLVDLLSAFLCIAISAAVIWLSLQYVQQSFVIDERSPDPGGLTHRWVLKALIPIGFACLILQCVSLVLGTLEKLKALKP